LTRSSRPPNTTFGLSEQAASKKSGAPAIRRTFHAKIVKVALPGGAEHDLLMTSFPVSHARDAARSAT
jgi:hypothetical protein